MKKVVSFCCSLVLALALVKGSALQAMTVSGTDFTSSFSHSYTTGAVFQYTTGNIFTNGWSESKQSVSTVEQAYVATQFISLNGHVSKEVNNFSSGKGGWVYSGRCYGQNWHAKKLMFYADVRRNGKILDELRVYYD